MTQGAAGRRQEGVFTRKVAQQGIAHSSAMMCKIHLAKHDVDHAFLPILQLKAEHKPLLIGPGHSCFLGKPFDHILRAPNGNVAILHLQGAARSLFTSWAGADELPLPQLCAAWNSE